MVFILTCLVRGSIIKNVVQHTSDSDFICLNTDKVQYCILKICFWEFLRMSIKKNKKISEFQSLDILATVHNLNGMSLFRMFV